MPQKFLDDWSSQKTCIDMHRRSDSIFVDWPGTIEQLLHAEIQIVCHFLFGVREDP